MTTIAPGQILVIFLYETGPTQVHDCGTPLVVRTVASPMYEIVHSDAGSHSA